MVTNAAARIRRFEVSPSLFRTIAITTASALWLIVVSGATVRLTGSGLGCEAWPGCQPGQPFPEKDFHSFIEFGNRLVGGIVIVTTLVAALAAFRVPSLPRWVRWTASASFSGLSRRRRSVPSPFASTSTRTWSCPTSCCRPWSSAPLSSWSWQRSEPSAAPCVRRCRGSSASPRLRRRLDVSSCWSRAPSRPRRARIGDSSDVRRLWRLEEAVLAHAVGTAVFGLCFAFMLGYLVSRRSSAPRLLWLALGVLGLVCLQILIGAVQYHSHLPWWLVLIHVVIAASSGLASSPWPHCSSARRRSLSAQRTGEGVWGTGGRPAEIDCHRGGRAPVSSSGRR